MNSLISLSPKELELMLILWQAAEPLARSDILERAEAAKYTWKPNSVHILLNSLLEKQAVRVAGYYLHTRKLGRTFEAAITREEYAMAQVRLAVNQGESVCGQRLPWMDEVVAALPAEK